MVRRPRAIGVRWRRPGTRRQPLSRGRPDRRSLPPLPPVRAPIRAAARRTSPARPATVRATTVRATGLRAAVLRGRGLRVPCPRRPRGWGPLPGVPLGAATGHLLGAGAPPRGTRFGRSPHLDLRRPLRVPLLGPPGAVGTRATLPIRPTPRTRDRLGHLLSASSRPAPARVSPARGPLRPHSRRRPLSGGQPPSQPGPPPGPRRSTRWRAAAPGPRYRRARLASIRDDRAPRPMRGHITWWCYRARHRGLIE